MSRIARIVASGVPHHVTQRGNYRQTVFYTDSDRAAYLQQLRYYGRKHLLEVWGYCLMPKHVHLVVVPHEPDSLAKALGKVNWRYAQYLHAQEGQQGHLWQSRFYSCPLSNSHLFAAMRYVELNPVRAGLAARAVDYPWSSACAHSTGQDPSYVLNVRAWVTFASPIEWSETLTAACSEEDIKQVRDYTYRGRPLGEPEFCEELRLTLGREVVARPVGRPRKKLPPSLAFAAGAGNCEIDACPELF
jgi:putative transposase